MPNIVLKINKSENEESKDDNINYDENENVKSKFSHSKFNSNNEENFEKNNIVNIKTFDNYE